MEMDERKITILKAVIRNYLETGEPVGSRTISKYTDLNLSSATIRNEMADLEEMGYIVQPHTSAGRIPSDAGYRFYVDNLMHERKDALDKREEALSKKEDILLEKVERVEDLLKHVAKTLATNTNYATMVAAPKKRSKKIKFIQVSQIENGKLLVVVVLDGNVVRNTIIESEFDVDNELCLKLNVMLNSSISGLDIEEINLAIITKLTSQAGEYSVLVRNILDAVASAAISKEDLQIYTSGAKNIFKYPELSDNLRASELIYTLEEKQSLANLITDSENSKSDDDIKVYIGEETPIDSMKDCSVVTATYEMKDGAKGTIGIIGPKRMDYDKVVETIKSIKNQLDDAF
ncbi:MAG: heat-inducible transcriptional repressor HrcA [Butyrivibrio sp.]|nr:heat-inducible transcriptional repressor HrcA [Butyrivibrio sp.]